MEGLHQMRARFKREVNSLGSRFFIVWQVRRLVSLVICSKRPKRVRRDLVEGKVRGRSYTRQPTIFQRGACYYSKSQVLRVSGV
jgi:hypothetical protein